MGKRELLILFLFLVVGGLVYQFTAPAADPGNGGRSWSDALRNIRGEMFGDRARLAVDRTVTASVGPAVEVLDLGALAGRVIVSGEDRDDLQATVRVSLLGEREEEIQAAAGQLAVEMEEREGVLALRLSHPDAWRLGSDRRVADVTVQVPRRLKVKLSARGTVEVARTAGAALELVRGTATLRDIAGPVTGGFRDGSLEVDGAASVELETRRVSVRLARVAGAIEVEGADGQVRGAQLPGPVVLDLRRMLVELDEVAGKVEVKGGDGRVELRRLSGPLSAEVERMVFSAAMAAAVEVDVEVGDAPLEFTLPPAGVSLDVEATEGAIDAPEGVGTVEREGSTQRLKGEVKGGGPAVRLRATRTAVVIRTP